MGHRESDLYPNYKDDIRGDVRDEKRADRPSARSPLDDTATGPRRTAGANAPTARGRTWLLYEGAKTKRLAFCPPKAGGNYYNLIILASHETQTVPPATPTDIYVGY